MSESFNMKIKLIKSKHVKGNYSMSNPNCILYPKNNKNLIDEKKSRKSSKSKSLSKTKNSVRPKNNRSFILKPKNKKENIEISMKIVEHRTISKKKKSNNNNAKNFLKVQRKNPFHARIKSLQINYKDKNYLYNINKTERNNYQNNNNSIKKNKFNDLHYKLDGDHNYNDDSVKKNTITNKINYLNYFEENEGDSTKNSKFLEQKFLNFDNYSHENKLIIFEEKNKIKDKNIKHYKIINRKNKNNNGNGTIKNFSKKDKIKVLQKSKIDILKPISSTSREKEKRDNSYKIRKKINNLKAKENKKNISNIVQRIKDKIHLIQNTIQDNNCNYNTTRNTTNKDISFNIERKTNLSKNNYLKNKQTKNKKNMNISSRIKSPSNLNQRNKNIYNEFNNSDISPVISMKEKKNIFKKKIKIYNKYNRNIKKLLKNKNNSDYNSVNSNQTFINKKDKILVGTKSQKDIFNDFIEKTLNKDEDSIFQTLKNEKSPKDLSDKEIEIMESLCEKGFIGRDIEKTNQDNFFIYKNFMNNKNYIFMGVCDGHGTYGHEVSGYLVYNIPLILNDFLKKNFKNISEKNISEIKSIIKNIFININKNISKDTDIDTTFSGSTCVSLIFTPSKLICANVGDSRCIIGKYDNNKWFSKSLSIDHKPDNKIEKERIINNGGRVVPYIDEEGEYYGPPRVWLKNDNVPGLAMSRSFGDIVAHSVGVISEPEILEYSFLEEDKFIILASDGIWEFISNDECIDIVKDYYKDKDINGVLNFLYREASKRWIINEKVVDDITLIIIFLR